MTANTRISGGQLARRLVTALREAGVPDGHSIRATMCALEDIEYFLTPKQYTAATVELRVIQEETYGGDEK